MAIDTTPANLLDEIEAAEEVRDTYLSGFDALCEQWTGSKYRDGAGKEHTPENHAHEYLSITLPAQVMHNPRVRAQTRRKGSARMVAQAIEHANNRWARDTDLCETLTELAVDFSFNFAFSIMHQGRPAGEHRDPAHIKWPQCHRISQRRAIIDPLTLAYRSARYIGHTWVTDHDDLLERAKKAESGWNKKAIQDLAPDTASDERHELGRDPIAVRTVPQRKEVVVKEVWIPDAYDDVPDHPGPDEGYHGTIYTIAVGGIAEDGSPKPVQWVRKPRAFFGPRWGPYQFGGAYNVPDVLWPLSPLVASAGQAEELNRHARAVSRSAESYKKLVFVDAANAAKVRAAAAKPHNFVIPIEGFDRNDIVEVEVGGFTPHMLAAVEQMRDRLDRVSGLSEAKRGNVSGAATATAEAIADNAIESRQAYVKARFNKTLVLPILRTAGWYFFHDDEIAFEMEPENGEMILDMMTGLPAASPWFMGGRHDADSGMRYEDIELELEAYSMEHVSEATLQRNAMMMVELITGMAPLIPVAPYVKWDRVLEQVGEAFNMPGMGRMVDLGMAGRLAGMQGGQQTEPVARIGTARPQGQRPSQQQPAPRQAPSATQGLHQSASFGQQQSQMRIGA